MLPVQPFKGIPAITHDEHVMQTLKNTLHRTYLKLRVLLVGPRVGKVDLGSLRRLTPISTDWGLERGQPVDQYYIRDFLANHANDIRGHVLEVGTDMYTRKFGGARVTKSDVLHVQKGAPGATIIADLSHGDNIQSNAFDCIIFTQTLQYIYDVRAALATLSRILKNRGVLLATFPGISKISREDMERWGDYWRFTSLSALRLLNEAFGELVEVKAYGNVLAATAFLHGLAAEELRKEELDYIDLDYEVVVSVRATK